ncbi:MAG: LacI family DNA-binding transcriptional regulator [Rhodocyclaceae bacterium]
MLLEKRVTISRVAAEAGVSKQTVSRVVNQSPSVSDATRGRVLETIARLGFRPSALARNLTSGRSHTIGIVSSDLSYINTDLYLGMARRAESLGYALMLKKLPDATPEGVENVLLSLIDQHVDGIIWGAPDLGHSQEWWTSERLAKVPVPIVFMSAERLADLNVVGFDNVEVGVIATRHLVSLGRKKIGHISGPRSWWVARQRVEGWQATLAEAGMPHGDDLIEEGDWTALSGQAASERLLDRHPDLDAIFVANDRMALGTMLTAHRRGLRIPQDLALIGVDNLPESACYHPPLTTVQQDKRYHGHVAITTLVRQIEEHFGSKKRTPAVDHALEHQLVVRESTPA